MRAQGAATVLAVALIGFVVVGTKQAQHPRTSRAEAGAKTVDCSKPPYRNRVRGTLTGNLEISVYPSICVVTGRVTGDVRVRNQGRSCTRGSDYVALSLTGGRIDGIVDAAGRRCVMVWLYDGAVVNGSIVYRASGNLGFLGDRRGARVRGSVLLGSGRIWATGASATNRIDGSLSCKGGRPAGSLRRATRSNWDGLGSDEKDESVDVDGSIGGKYVGCRESG